MEYVLGNTNTFIIFLLSRFMHYQTHSDLSLKIKKTCTFKYVPTFYDSIIVELIDQLKDVPKKLFTKTDAGNKQTNCFTTTSGCLNKPFTYIT